MNYKAPVIMGLYDSENPNLLNFTKENGSEHAIQFLNFLFPWSISACKHIRYLEIDCSFCLKPYVFSILMGIIDNESVPLSFTIGPSEKAEIYQIAFDELKNHGANLINIPILSDMGTAIEKFCNENNLKLHFYCWRHIIESFGAKTFVSLIVRWILKCNTYDEFETSLIEAFLDLIILKVDDTTISKFSRFVGFDYDIEKNVISKNTNFDNIKKWAIWERFAYSVSTCSNHIESMHRIVKSV